MIYGLLLGLLAVATYQNLSDVEKTVGNEAAALGALYRDVSAYPEPARSEVQAMIRDYTRYVIDEAWPLQQKGIVPPGAVAKAESARSYRTSAGRCPAPCVRKYMPNRAPRNWIESIPTPCRRNSLAHARPSVESGREVTTAAA